MSDIGEKPGHAPIQDIDELEDELAKQTARVGEDLSPQQCLQEMLEIEAQISGLATNAAAASANVRAPGIVPGLGHPSVRHEHLFRIRIACAGTRRLCERLLAVPGTGMPFRDKLDDIRNAMLERERKLELMARRNRGTATIPAGEMANIAGWVDLTEKPIRVWIWHCQHLENTIPGFVKGLQMLCGERFSEALDGAELDRQEEVTRESFQGAMQREVETAARLRAERLEDAGPEGDDR